MGSQRSRRDLLKDAALTGLGVCMVDSALAQGKPAHAAAAGRPAIGDEPGARRLGSPSDPRLKWVFEGQCQLYSAPLVADVHPAPGLETIVSDAEIRKLRCIDARGKQLWELGGVWKKRLIQAAVLSTTARPGKGTLLIGNGDGTLTAIDAESGKVLWQKQVGGIEWGSAMWVDLRGDRRDCAVAVTEGDGIVALDAGGNVLWRFMGRDKSSPHGIPNAASAADLDGDGKQEILAVTGMGPICVNPDGTLRWEQYTGDDYRSSATVADVDRDGKPVLFCASNDDNTLWCFDALTGAVRWRFRLLGQTEIYPGASIPVADVDGDGKDEVLTSDQDGRVYCVGADGTCRWMFQTAKRTHCTLSAGDVDGDGEIETLVSSGDHYLYCVDARGVLKWRFAADLRIVFPATIADIDGDGRTDILVASSDHRLRCLTLDGRYVPALVPWPSRRFDVAGSGAPFGRRPKTPAPIVETAALLRWGDFEIPKVARDDYPAGSDLRAMRLSKPKGWSEEPGSASDWTLTTDHFEGKHALRMSAAAGPIAVASDPVAIDRGLRSAAASVRRLGGSGSARLRWIGLTGTLREDALTPATVSDDKSGWMLLEARDVRPPAGARAACLVLSAAAPGVVLWDDARVMGTFLRPPALRVMVNQVGYDVGAPKRFTAQANFEAKDARFEVIDGAGTVVHTGALEPKGRIVGAYQSDWGFNYWRGDLTAFDKPGTYRVRITLDGSSDTSWPFEIARDLLWTKTARAAYRFFTYQRCGCDVPGFHKPCHLDDAASTDHKIQLTLWGGWHDAGDYNTYHNAPYVLGLGRAYEAQKALYDRQDEDRDGQSDFLDEVVWGAQHCARMIQPDGTVPGPISSGYGYWGPPELETDNKPGTGDERTVDPVSGVDPSTHIAAIAKAARYSARARKELMPALLRGMTYAKAKNLGGPDIASAVMDLYAITGDRQWADLATGRFTGDALADYDMARAYDAQFKTDHSAEMRKRLTEAADDILRKSSNPFGIPAGGTPDAPNYFGTPPSEAGWHVGNSSQVMNGASLVAQAYAYNPDLRYIEFVYDQFNWILGNNPYDISLMEGQGSLNPPSYHQRLTFAGVPRGAVPGSVVNGITFRAAGDDRPYFDMRGLDIPDFEPNEVWLPHNTAYLGAVGHLMMTAKKRL